MRRRLGDSCGTFQAVWGLESRPPQERFSAPIRTKIWGHEKVTPPSSRLGFLFEKWAMFFLGARGCGARPNRLLSRHAAPRRSGCGRGPQKMCAGRPLPQNGEGETGHATQRAEPPAAPRPLPCPGSAQAAVTAAPGTVFIPFSGFTDIQLTKIVYTIFYKPLLLKCSR